MKCHDSLSMKVIIKRKKINIHEDVKNLNFKYLAGDNIKQG